MTLTHPLLENRVPHGFGERRDTGPPDLRRPKQVHGAAVVDAGACAEGAMPEADAVVSRLPGAAVGVVTAELHPGGQVRVAGEEWTAELESGGVLAEGEQVTVSSVEDIHLRVTPGETKATPQAETAEGGT